MVLRFFAFNQNLSRYSGKLAKFLNDFMAEHRSISDAEAKKWRENFESTTELIATALGTDAPLQDEPNAVSEALFVGISKNIKKLQTRKGDFISKKFIELKADPAFSEKNLRSDISNKQKVQRRLEIAESVFS